jgi:hypothetical protein
MQPIIAMYTARKLASHQATASLTTIIHRIASSPSGCRSVPVDETAYQPGKRLMLGARFASSEKVSELDFGRRSAGRHVGFV